MSGMHAIAYRRVDGVSTHAWAVCLAAIVLMTSLAACRSPATECLVTITSDIPSNVMMTLSAVAADSAGHSANVRFGTRGPFDAGVHLPATFAVTPGAGPHDGNVRLTVSAGLSAASPGAPYLTITRSIIITFFPGITQSRSIFLSAACSAVVSGCLRVPATQCTRSEVCEEQMLTCGDHGECVEPPHSGGDGGTDSCVRSCGTRVCGDDGCGGSCGTCAAPNYCDTLRGQCSSSCGALGRPCCGALCTDSTTVCAGGVCVHPPPCGHAGEACCSSSHCLGGTVCGSGNVCMTPCGGLGEQCCGGSGCQNTLVCSGGTCGPPACTGHLGEPCCGGGCNDPLTICDVTSTCVSCGDVGQVCCGGACSTGYCNGTRCWAIPTLTEPEPESPGCYDFGIAHGLEYWNVTGRPGATGAKHVRQISCAGSVEFIPSDGCFTVGVDGTYRSAISNPILSDCNMDILGRWESWVVVDGVRSASAYGVFYNSGCATLSMTCGSGGSFCPTPPAVGPPMTCP